MTNFSTSTTRMEIYLIEFYSLPPNASISDHLDTYDLATKTTYRRTVNSVRLQWMYISHIDQCQMRITNGKGDTNTHTHSQISHSNKIQRKKNCALHQVWFKCMWMTKHVSCNAEHNRSIIIKHHYWYIKRDLISSMKWRSDSSLLILWNTADQKCLLHPYMHCKRTGKKLIQWNEIWLKKKSGFFFDTNKISSIISWHSDNWNATNGTSKYDTIYTKPTDSFRLF